jgi:low temperature requirement protein LtrA
MSAALPRAFGNSGLLIGCAYAGTQIGRSLFTVWAVPRSALRSNYQRILSWCCVSGGLAVAGGLVGLDAREVLWVAAVSVDLLGGAAGFYTPGLGRSTTQEWDIEGGHFAERCQAFILIALGESIVVIGATLARLLAGPLAVPHASVAPTIVAFVVAFAGSAGLWWIYFDRSAEAGARTIARSADPGRLGRTAYHMIHPIMVAGIIVAAAGDEIVLSDPASRVSTASAWLILGGPGLYIAGHAAFTAVVWRNTPRLRLAALVVLGLLGIPVVVAPGLTVLILAACATGVVVAVAVADNVLQARLRRTASRTTPSSA